MAKEFVFRGRSLAFAPGFPLLMGIVNATPDSFSDGGEFLSVEAAAAHAMQLLREGAAILDIDEPSKVLYRCENHLLTPEAPYETTGFVPNVVFPCATLQDGDTGRIAIYYGAADTNVGLAFTTVDEVVSYIKAHSVLHWRDDAAEDDF